MFRDNLRIDLPAAILTPDGNVQTRRYPLTLFCNPQARVVRLVLEGINYTPVVAKPELWEESSGGEYGRYTGSDGVIPVRLETTDLSPFQFALYNWSPDSPVALNLAFTAYQYGET